MTPQNLNDIKTLEKRPDVTMSVDPITVEIIRCALRAAANEMSVVLKKTAYNMMIYEVQDYCVSIVDHEGRTMSQNEGALPIFLADLGVAVQDGVEVYGLENIHPGDVFLVNHPEICGQHLNNMVVYTRFFWEPTLLCLLTVRAIPDGLYEASSFLDDDGRDLTKTLPIKVRVIVRDDELTIDFSDMCDQVPGFINCGSSGGMAAARVAFKALSLPHREVHEGSFRALKVILPPGKLLSARRPAPIGGWSLSLPTVLDTIFRALAPALPDRIPAAHKGDMGGYAIFGTHPKR